MQYVVSVEGLPVPCRAAVLKSLQSRLGLVPVPDLDRAAPLALLLHRVCALSKVPQGAHALCTGAWLATGAVHGDPDLLRLHRDLALALRARYFGDRGVTHLMVCMDACVHEAFEAVINEHQSGPARDTCAQDLRAFADTVAAVGAGTLQPPSPFDVQIVRVPSPPFAADTPSLLADLVDRACDAVARVLGDS